MKVMNSRLKISQFLVLIVLSLIIWSFTSNSVKNEPQIEPIKNDIKNDIKINKDLQLFQLDDKIDFVRLGDQLRIFKRIFDQVSTTRISRVNLEIKAKLDFLTLIEKRLFPWIQPSFDSLLTMRNLFKGDGIVICAADRHVNMVISLIEMIRKVHDCHLDIEIFYMGSKDLNNQNQQLLNSIPKVTTRNILEIFDDDILRLEGFGIKVFALLASSFRNAMLIDADVVFLQSPAVIFDHPSFQQHHAIFFRDRSIYSSTDEMIQWFHDILPKPPSEFSQEFRIFQGKTKHEQESGVVLIDKFYSLPGLLATCSLNVGAYRNVTFKKVFGDKETFWIGFEAVQQEYYFYPYIPGTLGISKQVDEKEYEICSRQILHIDHDQRPLWINGGITEYKMDDTSPLAKMDSWMVEPGRWHLQAHNLACLYTDREPIPLDDGLLTAITKSGKIYLNNRKLN
jgi:hypothetical protein